MNRLKNMGVGAAWGYALVAFCVGSATIVDMLFKAIPAVCK